MTVGWGGLIDWEAIVDRTRNLRNLPHWKSPQDIVRACARQFNFDLWRDQPRYVEVWIEKDALIGVIEGICQRFDVPHFSCRGYTSQSEMWSAAQRIIQRTDGGDKDSIIFHLGDHDPSGIDMTRDIQDRLALFKCNAKVKRLALNVDQVARYSPPPNPAKITDSRARHYIRRFGHESWELDALDPKVIAGLIADALDGVMDMVKWAAATERQTAARNLLAGVAGNWQRVTDLLSDESAE